MRRDDITPELVTCLVKEQMALWSDLPVTRVELEGWDNRTYRLGDELSVRLPSDDMYVAQVEKEQRWLPWLAPQLPVPIPSPVAQGGPGCGYPYPWSVLRWLPGRPATPESVGDDDLPALAEDVARFLRALHAVDATDGPPTGRHSHGRGAPVRIWDEETRAALDRFGPPGALAVWEEAVASRWEAPPVWVHGDVTGSNLLVADGRLSAVIDFGCCAVGDPACDLVMAWTTFDGADREAFRAGVGLDEATWARARGWALWKAVITRARTDGDDDEALGWTQRWGWRLDATRVAEEVVADATSGGG